MIDSMGVLGLSSVLRDSVSTNQKPGAGHVTPADQSQGSSKPGTVYRMVEPAVRRTSYNCHEM